MQAQTGSTDCSPAFDRDGVTMHLGECRGIMRRMPEGSVNCCVTSPPYWGLRDYGHEDQIGLEATPEQFVETLVGVFREVRRMLTDDGTLWLNLGDSYAGSWGAQSRPDGNDDMSNLQGGSMVSARQIEAAPKSTHTGSLKNTPGLKPKDLVGIPWRVALALQSDGWYLRQDIIWHKPSPMPESVLDRCTKSHEYIFLLSKSSRYHFDHEAIAEPCVESNDSRPRMGQGPNTQYEQKRSSWNGSKFHEGKTAAHHGKRRPSKNRGDFNGKTEAMSGTGQNAFRAVTETRNKRSVWTVASRPYKGAHFAVFPQELIEPCVLAGCPEGGLVLDPFLGSGTTAEVARRFGRRFLGCELNAEYLELAKQRFSQYRMF